MVKTSEYVRNGLCKRNVPVTRVLSGMACGRDGEPARGKAGSLIQVKELTCSGRPWDLGFLLCVHVDDREWGQTGVSEER